MAKEEIGGAEWLQHLKDDIDDLYATWNAAVAAVAASDAEALAKSIVNHFITPGNLAALGGTSAFAGLLQLASNAETLTGTNTAKTTTPADVAYALAHCSIILFTGKNGTGALTATGLKVGDIIASVTGVVVGDVGSKSALFETSVSIVDQIQQVSATDLSTHQYMALVIRHS